MTTEGGLRLGGARLWPVICLRSAGFPFEVLTPLAAAELAALADAGSDREALERLLADYWLGLPGALAAAPTSDQLLAALRWQNPAVADHAASPFLAGRYKTGNRKYRYKAAKIAKYLERYGARNETIGFFGPVAWGEITSSPGRLTHSPGESLIAELRVYLEDWAIQDIATALTRHAPEIYRPVLGPQYRVEDDALALPMGGRFPLTGIQAQVLRRCSGAATAADIATSLGPQGSLVPEILEEFQRRGFVSEVPLVDPLDADGLPAPPLAELRTVPDLGRTLAAIDTAIAEITPVARDSEALRAALDHLHRTFSDVTGRRQYRTAEETSTARTVARAEARRDVRLSLGADAVRDLDAPFRVIMRISRWLFRAAIDQTEQLLRDDVRAAGGTVPLCDLWLRHAGLWYAPRPAHLASLIAETRSRWATCLNEFDEAAHAVVVDPAAILATVERMFPEAPGPALPVEAYACPDILVDESGSGSGTAAAGVPGYVLGELHLGRNTLGTAAVSDCGDIGPTLDELWLADGGQPAAVSVSCLAAGRRQRSRFARFAAVELAVSALSPGLSRGAWRMADVDVLLRDDTLVAAHRSDRQELPLLALLSDAIAVSMANIFRLFPPSEHRPRVSLGPLVVARESWTLSAAEVADLRAAEGIDRFLGVRELARRRTMPRYLFAGTAQEEKPIIVDTSSPASVDVFVRRLRQHAGTCTLTEMLPSPGGLWLRDNEGRRYTSELRLALSLFDSRGRDRGRQE